MSRSGDKVLYLWFCTCIHQRGVTSFEPVQHALINNHFDLDVNRLGSTAVGEMPPRNWTITSVPHFARSVHLPAPSYFSKNYG